MVISHAGGAIPVDKSAVGAGAAASFTAGVPCVADPEAPYARLAAVALLARAQDERWLLLRRVPEGVWGPPGGRLERSESLEQALTREVGEETGLQVVSCGPCYAYEGMHKGERLVAVSFACRLLQDDRQPSLDPAEADRWMWASTPEWEALAGRGESLWVKEDVRRATALARSLLGSAKGMKREDA